jgi:choline dehydrogenase-like flavoprotein
MERVCIIGAGAAGCVTALRLARHGIKVTVLESGPRYSDAERLEMFKLAVAERNWGRYHSKNPLLDDYRNNGKVEMPLRSERVRALGGTTLLWLGNTPRMLAADFRMRSRFGLAADWPISYDELEPYYGQAEAEIGISGVEDNRLADRRSTPFPMPPLPFSYADQKLKAAADKLGIEVHHLPQARNSVSYHGRSPCRSCSFCRVCPVGAKATFDRTHAIPAEQTGNARFVTGATCLRIETDARARAKRVIYAGEDKVEHALEAEIVIVASGAIETARLLLLSKNSHFPDGLGNRSGLVGKRLMNHACVQVAGRVAEPVYPHRVGFEAIESFHYYATRTRDEKAGFLITFSNSGGLSPTPAERAAESPLWGDALHQKILNEFGHHLGMSALVEQLPEETNTVTLDPERRDHFGLPIPLVTYDFGDYAREGLASAERAMRAILEAAGAQDFTEPVYWWPGHHMGTVPMGEDPATSVVDSWLRSHDVPNLYLISSGTWVTGGCANPTLTLSALALRTADHIAGIA